MEGLRIVFLVKGCAAEDVKRFGLLFDYVIAHAAAKNISQIEVLKVVVFKIRQAEHEPALTQIEVHAGTAANGAGGCVANARYAAAGINLGGVQRQLGALGCAGGFSCQRETGGFRISAGETQAGVEEPAPQI